MRLLGWLLLCALLLLIVRAYLQPAFIIDAANLIAGCF